MNADTPERLVELLVAARLEGRAQRAADIMQALQNAEQAYEVQDAVAAEMGWFADAPPRYWKSGGASRDAVLTHAPLPPGGVRVSPADFSDLALLSPGIEAEIALRIGRDVTPEFAARLTPDEAASLVDAMTVSIEVVDSRWQEGTGAPALLRLADSQSHGALALGTWVPYAARDWSAQRCEVRIGAQPPFSATGTLSIGDPTWLLPAWLRHATRDGATIAASTVVTTGTWVGVLPARRGDTVGIEFTGIGRAQLRL